VPGRVVPVPTTARLFGEAAAAFLAEPGPAASTRRSCQQTLSRLEREFGADQPLTTLTTRADDRGGHWGKADASLDQPTPAPSQSGQGRHLERRRTVQVTPAMALPVGYPLGTGQDLL
jgi:hypothetical protein